MSKHFVSNISITYIYSFLSAQFHLINKMILQHSTVIRGHISNPFFFEVQSLISVLQIQNVNNMLTKVFKLENTGCVTQSRVVWGTSNPLSLPHEFLPKCICAPYFLLLSPPSSHSALSHIRRPFFSLILSPFSLVIVQLLQEKSPPPLFTWKMKLPKL